VAESIITLFEAMPSATNRDKKPSIIVSFTPAQSRSITVLLKIIINILHNQASLDADEIYVLNASKRIVNLFNATPINQVRPQPAVRSSLLWWRR
jgi:hypothetical protein